MQPRHTSGQVYEDNIVAYMLRPFARDLVERAAPRPGERVLDVACGTGVVARLLAPLIVPGGTVVGLDLDPAMLAVARERAESEDVAVTWQEGDAAALPFADASFDLALCQQGVQYVPDKEAALREMRRVLTHGGRAFVATWAPLAENPVQHVLDRVARERLGFSSIADRFGLGDGDTLRALMEKAEFVGVEVTAVKLILRYPSFAGFVRAATRADLAQLPANEQERAVDAIEEETRRHVGEYLNGEELRCQTTTHLATARR